MHRFSQRESSSHASLVASIKKACAQTRCRVTFRWRKSPSLSHFPNCQTGRGLWFGGRLYETPLVFSWPLEREGRRQLQMLLLTHWQPLALLEVRESEERERDISEYRGGTCSAVDFYHAELTGVFPSGILYKTDETRNTRIISLQETKMLSFGECLFDPSSMETYMRRLATPDSVLRNRC